MIKLPFLITRRAQEERERLAASKGAPTIDRDLAATQIQKVRPFKNNIKMYWQGILQSVNKFYTLAFSLKFDTRVISKEMYL